MRKTLTTIMVGIAFAALFAGCAANGVTKADDLRLPPSVSAAERAEIAAGVERVMPPLEAYRDDLTRQVRAILAQIESFEAGKTKAWEMDASFYNRFTLTRSEFWDATRDVAGDNKLLQETVHRDAEDQVSLKMAAIMGQIEALKGLWKQAARRFDALHSLPPTGISEAEVKEVSEAIAAIAKKYHRQLEAILPKAQAWAKAEMLKIKQGNADATSAYQSLISQEGAAIMSAYFAESETLDQAHPLYRREMIARKTQAVEPAESAILELLEVYDDFVMLFYEVEDAKPASED